MGWKSYRTVRLGASANFRILHTKISHETNEQWVMYGTMQSESARGACYARTPRPRASENPAPCVAVADVQCSQVLDNRDQIGS